MLDDKAWALWLIKFYFTKIIFHYNNKYVINWSIFIYILLTTSTTTTTNKDHSLWILIAVNWDFCVLFSLCRCFWCWLLLLLLYCWCVHLLYEIEGKGLKFSMAHLDGWLNEHAVQSRHFETDWDFVHNLLTAQSDSKLSHLNLFVDFEKSWFMVVKVPFDNLWGFLRSLKSQLQSWGRIRVD